MNRIRWTMSRNAAVLAQIAAGEMTDPRPARAANSRPCELAAWRAVVAAWGVPAQRATRLQILSGRRRRQTRRCSCAR
jgi:hypothetical protein